ncbi:LamG-like jellyroll fold domain-containing protein [Pyrococcus sp. ST04]|uniref:LamG-like jellyroll fold domain-containing protein n=1 Tax=Pyrococcus sp. ST04 TaxID=1183377 RepID=UPI00064E73FD|nr:LamG-like jellyroll fold domain-containing protein [Pyrococcus sp. ST04]
MKKLFFLFVLTLLPGLVSAMSLREYSPGVEGAKGIQEANCAANLCMQSFFQGSETYIVFTNGKGMKINGLGDPAREIERLSWGYLIRGGSYILALDDSLNPLWIREKKDMDLDTLVPWDSYGLVGFTISRTTYSGFGIGRIEKDGRFRVLLKYSNIGEGYLKGIARGANSAAIFGQFGQSYGEGFIGIIDSSFHLRTSFYLVGSKGERVRILTVFPSKNGYIVTGDIEYGFDVLQRVFFLMEINEKGNILWQKSYDVKPVIRGIKVGNSLVFLEADREGLTIFSTDLKGNIKWTKRIRASLSTIKDFFASDGSYMIVGTLYTGDFGGWGHKLAILEVSDLDCSKCENITIKEADGSIVKRKTNIKIAGEEWKPTFIASKTKISHFQTRLEVKEIIKEEEKTKTTTKSTPRKGVVFYDPLDKGKTKGSVKGEYRAGVAGECIFIGEDDGYITYKGEILPAKEGSIEFYWKPPKDIYKIYSRRHDEWKNYGSYTPPDGGFLLDNIGWRAADKGAFILPLVPISWKDPHNPRTWVSWSIWNGKEWISAGNNFLTRPDNVSVKVSDSGVLIKWSFSKDVLIWDPNEWYHIAVTWGIRGNELYINGIKIGEGDYRGPIQTNKDFSLGQNPGYWPYGPHSMLGCYDEFRVYNYQIVPEKEGLSKVVGYILYYDVEPGRRRNKVEVREKEYTLQLNPGVYYISIAVRLETGFIGPPTNEIKVIVPPKESETSSSSTKPSTEKTNSKTLTNEKIETVTVTKGICGPGIIVLFSLLLLKRR